MSSGASRAAIYEVLTISKEGKEEPLTGKTVNFNYYESLYSPVVSGNLTYVDAGGSVDGNPSFTHRVIASAICLGSSSPPSNSSTGASISNSIISAQVPAINSHSTFELILAAE